jgi:hypothetical protein
MALFLMLAQDQAGEQLGVGEVFATELRATLKGGYTQGVRRIEHHPWRFTGFYPAWRSDPQKKRKFQLSQSPRIETEQGRADLQNVNPPLTRP